MRIDLGKTVLCVVSLAMVGGYAMTATAAEAQKRPKTTAASASPKKPDTQRGQGNRAGTTQGSATSSTKRPNTNRNRAGYILTNPRKVTFKMPTKTNRTAASTLRRNGRGNQITRIGKNVKDGRSPNASRNLAAKQAQRGKPVIDKTSTAALRNAAANGFKPTAQSRGAARAGAAPIGSGQVTNPSRQWGELAAQTAQRKGLPAPRKGFIRRGIDRFVGLFSW
ncbi:MAG: hypothetical protein AAGL10_14955 [Pseudomonadota bacterium]